MNVKSRIIATIAAGAVALSAAATPALAQGAAQSMHRLYNPYSGEHFYTSSVAERDHLSSIGWTYEGVGWVAPAEGDPVYRLYNPYSGDHHYTTSAQERDHLVGVGWHDEGVGWRSGGEVAVLRQYNPYASTATHNYTTSAQERDMLIGVGWHDEGIGWYGVTPSVDDGHEHSWATRTVVDQAAWDEPTYEEQPVYEKQYVTVTMSKVPEWNGVEFTGPDRVDKCAVFIDSKLGALDAEYAARGEWAPDDINIQYKTIQKQVKVGTKKVQTGSVHHDAVTHEERYCAVCGAVA